MADFEVKFDSAKFLKALQVVPKMLARSCAFGLDQIGDAYIAEMQDVFTAQPKGKFGANTTANKLMNRTGALRRSLRQRVFNRGSLATMALRVTVGDSLTGHYAKLQEYGGTIKPKRARKLAIPLPANKTAAGRTRFAPRDVPGGFILPLPSNTFIASKDERGDLKLMYVLKDQVKVKARLGFRKRFKTKKNRQLRASIMLGRVVKALEKAGLST